MAQDREQPGAYVAAAEPGKPTVGAQIGFLRQILRRSGVAGEVIREAVERGRVRQGDGGEVTGTARPGQTLTTVQRRLAYWPSLHRAAFSPGDRPTRRCSPSSRSPSWLFSSSGRRRDPFIVLNAEIVAFIPEDVLS